MASPTDDAAARNSFLFDVRLVDRHLSQGHITRQELDKQLAALSDVADQAEAVDLGRLTSSAGRRVKG